jgi:phosphatidylserine/phosphatidylglycerophosphate/cardiolipin synthase-like enzyme
VERGVSFTRIFIQPIEILREMVDILEKQRDIGINVFVVLPDDLPHSARQDYIIVDDRAAARQVANIDGKLKEQIITIDQVEVAKMSKDFYLLRHYAINLEQIIDKLK